MLLGQGRGADGLTGGDIFRNGRKQHHSTPCSELFFFFFHSNRFLSERIILDISSKKVLIKIMPEFSEEFENRPLDGKKILLAEDQDGLRTIIGMMVEELGAEAITVADGQSAVDEYQRLGQEIDLVLLDLRMKGISGPAAFEQLVEIDPKVKVVFSSGVQPDDELLEMINHHQGGFLEKPFNLDRLGEVLVRVLGNDRYIENT